MNDFEARVKGLFRGSEIALQAACRCRVEPGWSRDWAFSQGAFGFWRVYWADQPMTLRREDGRRTILPADYLGLMPPGFRFAPDIAQPAEHVFVHYQATALPLGLVERLFVEPVILPPSHTCHGLLMDFRESWPMPDDPPEEPLPQTAFLAVAVAAGSLAAACRTLPEPGRQAILGAQRGSNPVSPALNAMTGDLARRWAVEDLAALCHMSRRQFSEQFRFWTLHSPHRYLMRQRADAALDLLSRTDLSLELIAERCGFADRYHFTKVITRLHGAPPARLRQHFQQRRTTTG